jgi:NADPH2 dehydrogenase
VEATCISPNGRLSETQLGLWSDDHIAGFRQIAEACHKYGAKILVQIHHAGISTVKSAIDVVAPSDYIGKSVLGHDAKARALTLPEIASLEQDFVSAAIRAQKAGLDGVELHGAHGYLMSQFFSPVINRRTDRYGGNVENRTRFTTEIAAAIRKATGTDFIIACRMGCNEPDLDHSLEIARTLEAAGIDMLSISAGMVGLVGPTPPQATRPPEDFPYTWIAYGGTRIKKVVKVPVTVASGIKTPEQAEYLVAHNLTDTVAIGRGLLADPDWANKAQKK